MNLRLLLTVLLSSAALSVGATESPAVTFYGIADAAVRHVTNSGTGSRSDEGTTSMKSGLSESRIGVRVKEDLGAGFSALAHIEHRFELDDGTEAPNAPFWQLAYVGLTTPVGRVTLGRQYNVLFDVSCTTFASFKFSPYIEAFKPEMGFGLGARQSDMVKYTLAANGVTLEAQWSAEDGETTSGTAMGVPFSFALPNKSRGAMARYEVGGLAFGGAFLEVRDSAGLKARGNAVGGSYASGPLNFNASYARNSFDTGFGSVVSDVPAVAAAVQGQLMNLIVDSGTTGVTGVGGAIRKREGYSVGATYLISDVLQVGAQYWGVHQEGLTEAGDGRGQLAAVVASYLFSKRTDAYAELDRSVFDSGAMALANGEKTRTGTMVGLRHRF